MSVIALTPEVQKFKALGSKTSACSQLGQVPKFKTWCVKKKKKKKNHDVSYDM